MAKLKIFITGDNGEELDTSQAAALIPGCTPDKIRYHVRTKDAKTIEDIRIILKNLEDNPRYYLQNPTYQTKYGRLTVREMWERHEYKDEVSITALSSRVSENDGMYPGIWGPLQRNSKNEAKALIRICGKCGKSLDIRQFVFVGDSSERSKICKKCLGLTGKTGKGRKRKVDAINVAYGDTVISKGKVYSVYTCEEVDKGKKWIVSAFLKMPNGQVLKNTTKYLGTDWQKAPCRH